MNVAVGPEHLKVHDIYILLSNNSGIGYDDGYKTWWRSRERNGREIDVNNQEIEDDSVGSYLIGDT